MEKETLLTGFNQRLGEPGANGMYENAGVSSRTLDAYIDNLLPMITDDAQVNDAFWERHIKFIKEMGGQMRHEMAEFAKNYKPQEKPAPVQIPPVDDGQKVSEELLRRLEALENERNEEKRQMSVKGLRTDVKGKAEELRVSNKSLWNDAVDMVEYKDGMSLDDMTGSAKIIYERKLKDYFGSGATPYGGQSTIGQSNVSETEANAKRDAFRKRMQSQGRLPKESK